MKTSAHIHRQSSLPKVEKHRASTTQTEQDPGHLDPVDQVISSGVLTPETLKEFGRTTPYMNVENPVTRKAWNAMATRLEQDGTLDQKDVRTINKMNRQARSLRASLRRERKGSDDPKINRDLQRTETFLRGATPVVRALATASARSTIVAAGSTSGPIGAIAAYAAAVQMSKNHLTDLVGHLDSLSSRKSDYFYPGNEVEPVHHEKLWKAKMNLLDEAIASAEAGKPLEIDCQYYELTSSRYLEKLAKAAKAGCPVRVNVDPTRAREGSEGSAHLHVDDGPKTFRSLAKLMDQENVDVGVSVYPVSKQLGNSGELMHRKLLRVGDKVLLGGMNANYGSGENVDAGWIIEGPAARALVEGFQRDVEHSTGATLNETYNGKSIISKYCETMSVTPYGMACLLDTFNRGDSIKKIADSPKRGYLDQMAGIASVELSELVDLPEDELDSALEKRRRLPLSDGGKMLLFQQLLTTLEATKQPNNVKSLGDISLPSSEVRGATGVAIGDAPIERETLMLHAIQSAEEFIYVPTFVITEPVARALAARKAELKAAGRKIDIRVVPDPGLYGYGGTPNERGVMALEDAGIAVRWARLPRSNRQHDRKVHAKQILTEKMELFGSTNLSRKGLKDNWEISGLVVFDEQDPDSIANREDSKGRFLRLWDDESFGIDTRRTAEKRMVDMEPEEREHSMEWERKRVLRSALRRIQHFENEAADWVQEKLTQGPIAKRARELFDAGSAPGYAKFGAIEEAIGTEAFYDEINHLPSMTKLRSLRRYG
jgi:phosphatidylserine/phosphatidylglycerophosphate/cardiolipin synthase-like enzyme